MKKFLVRLKKAFFNFASPETSLLIRQLRSQFRDGRSKFARSYSIESSFVKKKILILAPHPDDEVVGPGGVLDGYLKMGSLVTVVYMTSGGKSDSMVDDSKKAAKRHEEALELANKYSFNQIFLEQQDGDLTCSDENVNSITGIVNEFNPDEIYVPSFYDIHPDHIATSNILLSAIPKCLNKNFYIVGYEVWENLPFPNHFVDISANFKNKINMLESYRSQLDLYDYRKLCDSRNRLHYDLIFRTFHDHKQDNVGYAEAFLRFPAEVYLSHALSFREIQF